MNFRIEYIDLFFLLTNYVVMSFEDRIQMVYGNLCVFYCWSLFSEREVKKYHHFDISLQTLSVFKILMGMEKSLQLSSPALPTD